MPSIIQEQETHCSVASHEITNIVVASTDVLTSNNPPVLCTVAADSQDGTVLAPLLPQRYPIEHLIRSTGELEALLPRAANQPLGIDSVTCLLPGRMHGEHFANYGTTQLLSWTVSNNHYTDKRYTAINRNSRDEDEPTFCLTDGTQPEASNVLFIAHLVENDEKVQFVPHNLDAPDSKIRKDDMTSVVSQDTLNQIEQHIRTFAGCTEYDSTPDWWLRSVGPVKKAKYLRMGEIGTQFDDDEAEWHFMIADPEHETAANSAE